MVNLSAIIFIVTKGIVKQDNQTGNVMETTTFPKETSSAFNATLFSDIHDVQI